MLINKNKAKKRAFTLMEVLVAMIITAIGVITFISINLGYTYNVGRLKYYFVAVNLAREIQEYFESIRPERNWSMSYYYADSGTCYYGPGPNAYSGSGYCLRSASIPPATAWVGSALTRYRPDETPFDVLNGLYPNVQDIKAKNLVPKGASNSVRIDCTATYNGTYEYYVVTTTVTWQDLTPQGQLVNYSETLSVIPLTPVNNQIMMQVGELRWD